MSEKQGAPSEQPPSYADVQLGGYPDTVQGQPNYGQALPLFPHGQPTLPQGQPTHPQVPQSFYANQNQLDAQAQPYGAPPNIPGATPLPQPVVVQVTRDNGASEAIRSYFRMRCAIIGGVLAVKVVVIIIVLAVFLH